MVLPFGFHKDKSPEETVADVQAILERIGLDLDVTTVKVAESFYFSSLIDREFPMARSSGKGATELQCLASGHAEFLERLQNAFLYRRTFGLMPEAPSFYSDEIEVDTARVVASHADVIAAISSAPEATFSQVAGSRMACAPFLDLDTRKTVQLPIRAIEICCGTNGCCAGNTPEEAILQGIGEVLERYVRREVMVGRIETPTFLHEHLADRRAYPLLQSLEDAGFSVMVKDCSLGGTIPVVGLILFNRDRTRYRVTFGSDPVFDVALQRAACEATQGYDDESERSWPDFQYWSVTSDDFSTRDRLTELFRSNTQGNGRFPGEFLFSRAAADASVIGTAFQRRFVSHRDSLRWIVGRVQDLGHRLYVRDVSLLGFPSFHVYVPGLSEWTGPLDEHQLRFHFVDRETLRQTLFRLADASEQDLRRSIEIIEEAMEHPLLGPLLSDRWMFDWLGLSMRDTTTSFGSLQIWQLLALLCMRLGESTSAAEYLRRFMDKGADLQEMATYTRCVATVLSLVGQGLSEDLVQEQAAAVYGPALTEEVLSDISDPTKTFQWMALPNCGDCEPCPASDDCQYPRWRMVRENLSNQSRQSRIEQDRLLPIFS